MPDIFFVGDVDSPRRVTATVVYNNDYRDENGVLPRPVYRFEKKPGQPWTDFDRGGSAKVLGPNKPGTGVPQVTVTYTIINDLGHPWARSVERRILPNTTLPGYWDFTKPDSEQPIWQGSGGAATPVTVLPGTGEKGDPGSQILTGSLEPDPTIGRNGDLYINYTTTGLYQKISDSWVFLFLMQGSKGGSDGSPVIPIGGITSRLPLLNLSDDGKHVAVGVVDGIPKYILTASTSGKLSELSDVDVTGLTDGGILRWDEQLGKFMPVSSIDAHVIADTGLSGDGTSQNPLRWTPTLTDQLNGLGTPDSPFGIAKIYVGKGLRGKGIFSDPIVSESVVIRYGPSSVRDNQSQANNVDGDGWYSTDTRTLAFWNSTLGKWENFDAIPSGGTPGQVITLSSSNTPQWSSIQVASGIPAGGLKNQVLTKNSDVDGDIAWATVPVSLPQGGLTGHVLTKLTNNNGDAQWQPIVRIPDGGTTNQVLAKASNADGDLIWITPGSGSGGAGQPKQVVTLSGSAPLDVPNPYTPSILRKVKLLSGGTIAIYVSDSERTADSTRLKDHPTNKPSSNSPLVQFTGATGDIIAIMAPLNTTMLYVNSFQAVNVELTIEEA